MNDQRPVKILNIIRNPKSTNQEYEVRVKIKNQDMEHSVKKGEFKHFGLSPTEAMRFKTYLEGKPALPEHCPVSLLFDSQEEIDVSLEWKKNREEWILKVKPKKGQLIPDPKDVNVTIGEPNRPG